METVPNIRLGILLVKNENEVWHSMCRNTFKQQRCIQYMNTFSNKHLVIQYVETVSTISQTISTCLNTASNIVLLSHMNQSVSIQIINTSHHISDKRFNLPLIRVCCGNWLFTNLFGFTETDFVENGCDLISSSFVVDVWARREPKSNPTCRLRSAILYLFKFVFLFLS